MNSIKKILRPRVSNSNCYSCTFKKHSNFGRYIFHSAPDQHVLFKSEEDTFVFKMGKVSNNKKFPNRQKNESNKKGERGPQSSRHGKKIIGKVNREMLTKKIGKAPKGKKHKKIKAIDPFYRGDRKHVHEKKMLNKAPKNNDDDQFPGKLKEILRFKEELENKKQKKAEELEISKQEAKSKKKFIPVPAAQNSWPKPQRRPAKTDGSNEEEEVKPLYVPEGQKEGETAVSYLRRANQELSDVFEKTMLFQKYGIDFTDMNSGKMEKLYGMNDKKRQRLKEIAKDKKQRKLEKQNDRGSGFEHLEDNVEFGEVVMSPPEKLAKPRHADPAKLSKPGRKELLLKTVMEENTKKQKELTQKNPKTEVKKTEIKKKDKHALKKTTKLKYLPPVRQTILNEERERVVKLYREMKKKNREKQEG